MKTDVAYGTRCVDRVDKSGVAALFDEEEDEPAMGGLAQDLRYALRQLRKNPGFTGTATLTLAFAIGAASSVFSVVYSELIRPLPYARPEMIFYLETYSPEGYTQPSSYPEYQDWRRENHVFLSLTGFSTFLPGSSNLEGPTGPVASPCPQSPRPTIFSMFSG